MFDLELLREAFESELGSEYQAINVWSAPKIPQGFLIKGPGVNNLFLRLAALKEDGKTIRNLQPNDKNVIVIILTLNEKGNTVEFRGNFGDNPLKTIGKLFDTFVESVKLTQVETVLFRFPTKSIKGQKNQVKRIIDRLLVVRGRGRFVTMPELVEHSKKYAYILAHKKNMDVLDIPGAEVDSEKFKEIETKVGKVYIDDDSGKEVSKTDVAAVSIAKNLDKITTSKIISSIKLDRRIVAAAQYSAQEYNVRRSEESKQQYEELITNVPVYAGTGEKSKAAAAINSLNMKELYSPFSNFEYSSDLEYSSQLDTFRKIKSSLGSTTYAHSESELTRISTDMVRHIGAIMAESNPKNIQSAYAKIANYVFKEGPTRSLPKDVKLNLLKRVISNDINQEVLSNAMSTVMTTTEAHDENIRRYSEEQTAAINKYTTQMFEMINNTLIGKEPKIHQIVMHTIKDLDGAFENGTTLEKGTLLYRGQRLTIGQFEPIVDSKLMYFRNYVSASLYPIIYGGFANASDSLPGDAEDVSNTDFSGFIRTSALNVFDSRLVGVDEESLREKKRVSMGIVIKGGHKIKTIVPGKISEYHQECEVILPRGTMLKLDKVTASMADDDRDNTVLIESTVIGPEQFDESMGVYDGDKFFSEGVLEKLEPTLFGSLYSGSMALNEDNIPADTTIAEVMTELVDLNGLSSKFTE